MSLKQNKCAIEAKKENKKHKKATSKWLKKEDAKNKIYGTEICDHAAYLPETASRAERLPSYGELLPRARD